MTPQTNQHNRKFNRLAMNAFAFVLVTVGFGSSAFAVRNITSVSLNGGAPWTFSGGTLILAGDPVTVLAGETISVNMTVVTTGTGNANDWQSTAWQIGSVIGTWTCNTDGNFESAGTHNLTFDIIAGATSGTFNSYFRAHDENACGAADPSAVVTLANSVTIQPPATNPSLADACGLDIVLVLDTSGSIGGNLDDVQNAALDFVNAFLPATPTLIGLVEFNDDATMLENLTSNTAALSADIGGLASGGFTNWEDAIQTATAMLEGGLDRPDSIHPDMIVMITDGDPTASSAGNDNSNQPNVHLYPAVVAANDAKTSSSTNPIRIVTVGVGAATQSRLVAISGSNVHPPNPLNATTDVVLSDFDDLAGELSDLAVAICGGTITVHKVIDVDGNTGTTGDQTDGAGWSFAANPDAPDTTDPTSGSTDSFGMIIFDVDVGANNSAIVDITETMQTHFQFISANCVNGMSSAGTPATNAVNNIPLSASDIISCTFYNQPKTGACCKTFLPGSNCTNNVPFTLCDEPGFVFSEGMTCAQVSCCSSDALCADSDPCTVDMCVNGVGCVSTPINCNDNNPCTIDSCFQGSCVNSPVTCPDNNDPCTDLACDANGANGNCDSTVPVNNGAPCDDLFYCTIGETCTGGICGGGSPLNCSDEVGCTNDSCDETNDVCVHNPNNSKCDDGLYCNGAETCDGLTDCADGADPCSPPQRCDEVNDRCVQCLTDAQCDDGAFCNGAETCNIVSGTCQPGANPCPADSVSCTIDSCDEANNVCLHEPNNALCQNGNFCDGQEVCDRINGCVDSPDPCNAPLRCDEPNDRCVDCLTNGQCDDGLFCNGSETCNTTTGTCQPGTDPCPADSVACTIDTCDEDANVCLHTPNNSLCQNGNFCDGQEVCDRTLGCQDAPDPCTLPQRCDEPNDRCVACLTDGQCDDGLYCNGTETCNVAMGVCVPGTAPCPADGVACSIETCNESTNACEQTLDHASCQNGLFCDGAELCDPVLGCVDSADPCSPDSIACTNDYCDENRDLCMHVPMNSLCDDGAFCNGVETCDPLLGCQAGTSPCPSDGIDCTTDTCDESTDQCQHTPSNAFCDDGAFCNGAEVCDVFNDCVAGTEPCPADSVACTIDSCDEVADQCLHTPSNGLCTDGAFCNGVEICDPLLGCIAGANPCPPDSIRCTIDSCNESTDTCLHVPTDSLCSDEQFCTGVETCNGVAGCQNGPDPDCSFLNNACNMGVCNESNDQCQSVPTNQGGPCVDDGLFCNGSEVCNNGNCVSTGNPCQFGTLCDELNDECVECFTASQCDDNNNCTMDNCTNGTCTHFDNGSCDGACCNFITGTCTDGVQSADCPPESTFTMGQTCANLNCQPTIPTVSEWGMVVMTLLLLTGGKLYFGRRTDVVIE